MSRFSMKATSPVTLDLLVQHGFPDLAFAISSNLKCLPWLNKFQIAHASLNLEYTLRSRNFFFHIDCRSAFQILEGAAKNLGVDALAGPTGTSLAKCYHLLAQYTAPPLSPLIWIMFCLRTSLDFGQFSLSQKASAKCGDSWGLFFSLSTSRSKELKTVHEYVICCESNLLPTAFPGKRSWRRCSRGSVCCCSKSRIVLRWLS